MRFAVLLETLPIAALERLLAVRGTALDPKKILSPAEQTARALARLPARLLSGLTPRAREALDRLVPAPGVVARDELGDSVRELLELGLAFPLGASVVCPAAIRVQLPGSRREDPRGARALLSTADEETLRSLLRGHTSGARALVLGELLERLEDPALLAQELATLPLPERLALSTIEARGSEVSGSELLAIAREPARWETPGALPKKGPAHALIARGYLFAAGHDRFVLASEVAAIAGKERREVLERRRRALLEKIEAAEDEPARADLARDPGPLALALLVELADGSDLPRDDQAVRRSELVRAARALDVAPERAELLIALARALPLHALTILEVGPRMLAAWRRTAVHDESATTARERRGPSAITLVRELALDALSTLPRGRFVGVEDVLRAARADQRAEAIETGMRPRGVLLDDVLGRIVLVSLPALGLVDVARDGRLRLASRARALGSGDTSGREGGAVDTVTWSDRRVRFSPGASVSVALGLAKVARAAVDEGLVLSLDPARPRPLSVEPAALGRALARARCPDDVQASVLASLPSPIAVLHASAPARWIAIADPALRARLLEDPKIVREVIDGGPPGGLLLHAHGSFPRIVRLFARHGIDLRDRP